MTTPRCGGPEAESVYAAERLAAESVPLRRFARFAEVEAYLFALVQGSWWSHEFPDAPLEVVLERRSRSATWSAAGVTADDVAVIWLVDGLGWGLETILHEIAHVAAGPAAGHGGAFCSALLAIWRHEAGFEAWAALQAELGRS